ncbi:MAG: DUF1592 domain-containing protein [Planctomycetaceae bacterium]
MKPAKSFDTTSNARSFCGFNLSWFCTASFCLLMTGMLQGSFGLSALNAEDNKQEPTPVGKPEIDPAIRYLAAANEALAINEKPAATEQGEYAEVPIQPIPDINYETQVKSFLTKYCIDCHGPDLQEGGLQLHDFDSVVSMREQRKTWKHLSQLVEISAMPPVDADPVPTKEEREQFVQIVDLALNYVDCSLAPDPGRVTIRRLNRNEYNNTVRDLVGLDLELVNKFPTDDVGEGFDNIGDVLSLSPILFEKYLNAAEYITSKVIVDEFLYNRFEQTWVGLQMDNYQKVEVRDDQVRVFNSNHTIQGNFTCYQTDTYDLVLDMEADQAGPDPAQMNVTLDGELVGEVQVKGKGKRAPHTIKVPITEGEHKFAISFVNDFQEKDENGKVTGDRNVRLFSFSALGSGPMDADKLPPYHREIIFCRPDEAHTAEECARLILDRFASRAYRRPATAEEVSRLVDLALLVIQDGKTFEEGIEQALHAVLVSPHFLFRVELDDHPDDPTLARKLSDYELASRLSYFIWSSMPDEELFSLAAKNQLHYQSVLESQVRRMIQDPKADALVSNFGGQWLNLRRLSEIHPDSRVFGEFYFRLALDIHKETELFFAHIMRENMSIFAFLDGDFTFINKRLAEHYGYDVEGRTNEDFELFPLTDLPRRGVLTQASVLLLTSNPDRTAPVKRGKWIMENILGEETPPPPPNVPPLEELAEAPQGETLREKFARHRADAGCASCHNVLDPLGFGLENFNVIGQWREKDGEFDVDASGVLPSGETFNGPLELVSLLKTREENFRQVLAEKMLVFATGRGLNVYDQCAVNEITDRLKKNDDRFFELVMGIVDSQPFQKRRGEEGK